MTSQEKMKVQRQHKLKLRPFWLGDFGMIRRIHTVMKKNKENSILLKVLLGGTEKVLKIASPVINSLVGLKNIIKKNIFKALSTVQTLDESREVQETKRRKVKRFKYRNNLTKKTQEPFLGFGEDNTNEDNSVEGNMMNSCPINKMYTRQAKKYQMECRSCLEDRAACKTCSSCFKLDPSLPHSSCVQCQERGPLVNMCTRFHDKQPIVHLPKSAANEELFDKFKQRREILKVVSKFCKGNSPKINHCPMCSSIKPQMGDCSCKNCKKIQPIVKLAKQKKNTVVEMCPCQDCSHLRPKVKVCEDCKNVNLNKATSYYVILSSK